MGFDRQSRRRISRSVLFTERLNRSRTPRVGGNRNPSKNPIYWAVATEDIVRGLSGTVQLVGSNGSPIAGETRTAFNDYETTVWQDANCIITIVDEEFRIIDADVATILLCATTGPVAPGTASFSASVIKDLDGHYGKPTITAQNTFSQEYDPSELFLAFRNEEDKTWVADKVGGSGGNEVLIRFELTAPLTLAGTSAAAETLDQAGVPTGTAIIVHDRVGEWAGAIGYEGIAFRGDNVAGEYDIVFLEAIARWVQGTLSGGFTGGAATLSVAYYWGSAPNGRNPGSPITVYDELDEFYWGKAGDKCIAVWDEQRDKYIVVWIEFPADVFAVDLIPDGGSAGSNAVSSCTLTYTVFNAQTGDEVGEGFAPLHPRPALTQMVAATRGLAHWEKVGGSPVLVLDHAFEVPTPRVLFSPVTSVTCNAAAGMDIWKRDCYLPVGSRVDAQFLHSTIVCPGFGAVPGCGLDEPIPGQWEVEPADLVGLASATCLIVAGSCGLAVDLTPVGFVVSHEVTAVSVSHATGTLTVTVHVRVNHHHQNACGLVVDITDEGTDQISGTLMTEPCPP